MRGPRATIAVGRRAAAALVVVACASLARAGDETQVLRCGVQVRAWSPWPNGVHHGWAPLFVELRNGSENGREVQLDARSYDWMRGQRIVTSQVSLAAGASTEIELMLPLGGDMTSEYSLEAAAAGERIWFSTVAGASRVDPSMRCVLLVSDDEPEAGAIERWNDSLSSDAVKSGAKPAGATHVFGAVSTSTTAVDVDIARASASQLPRRSGAYTSLSLVVLDADSAWPAPDALAALASWARTGGDVLVIGAGAHRAARATPEFAEWMTPRFATSTAAGAVDSEYRIAFGRLFVRDASGELGGEHRDGVRAILGGISGPAPHPRGWRSTGRSPTLDLEQLPHDVFAVLLLVFAIAIGPVNFYFVHKRRRPVLLLLTIPAISVATTLLLLAYGVLYQGLDVKTASVTTAVLDQRAHRVTLLERRSMFAGWAPAAGLRPGAGAVVHHSTEGETPDRSSRFEVVESGGLLLRGRFLPTRRRVTHAISSDRVERAHLDVEFDGDQARVANNLGVGIGALVVCDTQGRWYTSPAPLSAGAQATLRVADAESAQGLIQDIDSAGLPVSAALAESVQLPPGCYFARLEEGVFRDDCGIETNEIRGSHVLFGVLDDTAEERR